MIERKTVIDQIEITRDGTIQIRLGLLIVEDGVEIDRKWHRTALPPGADLDEQMRAVNEHLVQSGKPAVTDAENLSLLKSVVGLVHTGPLVDAYRLRRLEEATERATRAQPGNADIRP